MSRPRTLRRGAVASLVAGLVFWAVLLPLAAPLAHAVDASRELGLPHVSSAPAVAPHRNVTINTSDVPAFVPNAIHATSGENLTIKLVNIGTYNHTFTMSRNGTETFPRNWTPAQLSAYFTAHPPLVNVSMPANSIGFVNVSVNASMAGGHFEFVSLVPYQFQAGLFGFLNVTPPVSETLTFYVNASDSYKFIASQLDGSAVSKFPVAVDVYYGTLGVLSHTFTLSPVPNYNLSSANFSTFFTQHTSLINLVAPTSPGTFTNGSFVITAPGFYEFICTIPGHFVNGMFGFLYMGVPLPVPAVVENVSTAIVQSEVLIGGGALIGIGALLAVAAMVSGRIVPSEPTEKHH